MLGFGHTLSVSMVLVALVGCVGYGLIRIRNKIIESIAESIFLGKSGKRKPGGRA